MRKVPWGVFITLQYCPHHTCIKAKRPTVRDSQIYSLCTTRIYFYCFPRKITLSFSHASPHWEWQFPAFQAHELTNMLLFLCWLGASRYALMWRRDAVSEFICDALMWQHDAVSEFMWASTWLCSRTMQFQSMPTIWPLLTTESPVAQW